MNVLESAGMMKISIEKMLNLCAKLGITAKVPSDVLSEDDLILVEYELDEANNLNSSSSDDVGNINSKSSGVDNGLNVDPNYLASGAIKLSSYVTSLENLKSSFSGINLLPGVEDGSITYCNDYTSQCYDCASSLVKKVNNVKTSLANIDANVALLFDIYEGKFTNKDGGLNASNLINYINSNNVDYVTVSGLLDDAYANGLLNFENNSLLVDTVGDVSTGKNKSAVPLYYQSDYTDIKYGTGTLATHGCGITSLSMVASYYNDKEIMPDELAEKYRGYGSKSGTDHMIFEKTADALNLPFQEHVHYSTGKDLQKVVDALEEGCIVIAKAKKKSIFTESGHYIVLTGVTEDGKITVNDPNKWNYKEFTDNPGASQMDGQKLTEGFENGFSPEEFKYGKVADFFIYSTKKNS